jgi:hypothetical protein
MTKILRIALSLLAGMVAHAQPSDLSYTRFLLPFYAPPMDGAHGSRWVSETWMHYSGPDGATIFPTPYCYAPLCPTSTQLHPGVSALPIHVASGFESSGILFHIESSSGSGVVFESRIKDLHRQSDSAGPEVPVVREDRFLTTAASLLNVPQSRGFRNLLRIYALPETANPLVEIRYYELPDADTGRRVGADAVPLRVDRVALQTSSTTGGLNLRPSYAAVAHLQSLPEVAAVDAIWIEVVPLTAGLKLWAFVSVTNNATQQATLVTPIGR